MPAEFNNFQCNFDKILKDVKQLRSMFLVILGNFNTRTETWWGHVINTNKCIQVESLTLAYGLHQLISDPTYFLPNSSYV